MAKQQGEDIRPADEIRDDLVDVEAKIGDVLEEGQRKLDLAEDHDRPLEKEVFIEERQRLDGQVIKPLEQAQKDVAQVISDLDAGTIDAAKAQKALESLNQAVEDAESTVEDVGLEELDDNEDDDEDDDEDE